MSFIFKKIDPSDWINLDENDICLSDQRRVFISEDSNENEGWFAQDPDGNIYPLAGLGTGGGASLEFWSEEKDADDLILWIAEHDSDAIVVARSAENRALWLGGSQTTPTDIPGLIFCENFENWSGQTGEPCDLGGWIGGENSVVVGGADNLALGENSSVVGGNQHRVEHDNSVILGGQGINTVAERTAHADNIHAKGVVAANNLALGAPVVYSESATHNPADGTIVVYVGAGDETLTLQAPRVDGFSDLSEVPEELIQGCIVSVANLSQGTLFVEGEYMGDWPSGIALNVDIPANETIILAGALQGGNFFWTPISKQHHREKTGGGLFWNGNDIATPVSSMETYYNVVIPSTGMGTEVNVTVGSGTLTVTDPLERTYLVTMSACLVLTQSNQEVRARITRNGDDLEQTCAQQSVSGNPQNERRVSLGTHIRLRLSAGDVIGMAVGNWTSTTDITVRNAQISITEV